MLVWLLDSRSRVSQGFDWRKAQRDYYATARLDERPHVIRRTIVVDDKGTTAEETCETCHVGMEKDHPGVLLAAHPKNVGCTHCHGGAPGELSTNAHAKKDLRAASCMQCHGTSVKANGVELRAAADKAMGQVLAGARIYEKKQCAFCHESEGAELRAGKSETRRPMPLTDVHVRRRPEHVLAWLLHPSRMDPRGAMPRFFEGRRDDALAVTAYLLSRRKDATLDEDAQHGANVTGASADEGAKLYAALGCAACHASAEAALGPSLDDVGRKSTEDWLATYLRDPSRAHPRTRMPSFRLDAREAASLAKHLAAMTSKEPLPLSADEARIVSARDLGTAKVDCSTGPATTRAECGQRLYKAAGCAACHDSDALGVRGTVGAKLADELAPAPTFHDGASPLSYPMADADRAAVTLYLEARRLPPAPLGTRAAAPAVSSFGQELMEDLGCRACHGNAENPASIASRPMPPSLSAEGKQARPEWLFAFLRRPGALGVRPAFHPEWVWGRLPPLDALAPRMPTFALTEEETTAIVRSMVTAFDAYPFTDTRPTDRTPEERLAAFVLLNRGDEKTRCTSCHFTSDVPVDRMKQDAASVAPGFNGLVLRRRPEWVRSMLPAHDASHYAAGKPRPAWTEKDTALVTDVLFSLDDRAKLPRAGEEARAPLP